MKEKMHCISLERQCVLFFCGTDIISAFEESKELSAFEQCKNFQDRQSNMPPRLFVILPDNMLLWSYFERILTLLYSSFYGGKSWRLCIRFNIHRSHDFVVVVSYIPIFQSVLKISTMTIRSKWNFWLHGIQELNTSPHLVTRFFNCVWRTILLAL